MESIKGRRQISDENAAILNFQLEGRVLYYKKVDNESESWKICVQSDEEKTKIIESCHAGVGGM